MDIYEAIPRPVIELCERLRENDKRGWVVGGCVRDLLRGAPAKDWDIATDARPEEVKRIFKRVIPTGIQHGTVTVLLEGEAYEVTTLRGEGAYEDGRRPEEVVFLDDITQDLARRDFTFNAIAIEPLGRTLVDPFGGERDLSARLLRAVGEPAERFQEDGLRLLRGARFAAALECEIEPKTLAAMGDPKSVDTLRQVSAERVHDEWQKTMRADKPSIAFDVMEKTGILDVCCPELRQTVKCMDTCGLDVWTHSLRTVDALHPRARIAGLLHDIAKPRTRTEADGVVTFPNHAELGAEMADGIMRRLKFSNDDRTLTVDLVRKHVVAYEPGWTDAAIRRWLRHVTRERFDEHIRLYIANANARGHGNPTEANNALDLAQRAQECLDGGTVLTPGDLCLRGKDLITQLQIAPGPIIGEALRKLVDIAIENPAVNEPKALLEEARRVVDELRGAES